MFVKKSAWEWPNDGRSYVIFIVILALLSYIFIMIYIKLYGQTVMKSGIDILLRLW